MIKFVHHGDFKRIEKFLNNATLGKIRSILESYAKEGVSALASATPVDTGLTSESWSYEVVISNKGYSIYWYNENTVAGVPLVILLQYGHGTGNGGYVQGRDFINPAIRPVFDKIAEKVWEEVTSL